MVLASKDKLTRDQNSGIVIIRAEAARVLLERRMMRANLSPFIKKVFETVDPGATYLPNWHIDIMSEYLMACYLGQINRLIINVPPRFLKSIAGTIAFPAWVLGLDPSEQFICASYSGNVSLKHSLYTRRVIDSDWYKATFPDTIISADQNEKRQYVTTKMGHRIATSVGGTATGDGGNYQMLDDPINPDEALSDTVRAYANNWIDQTWSSRKNNPKKYVSVLIMQRLHVKDPTGHLMSKGGYEHLVIPQEAEKKTIIIFPLSKKKKVREEGELLHPKRFGIKEKLETKTDLGTYGYSGQQQQRPAPLKGGRIQLGWFRRYKEAPVKFDEIVFSADTAQKPKEINDPSVVEIYGRIEAVWYLVHIWKHRAEYPLLKSSMKSLYRKWNPDAILIEDKSSGSSLIQDLRDDKKVKYPIIAMEPEADKVTRMDVHTPSIENGLIALPDPDYFKKLPWLSDLEEYLMHFPKPEAWDEIDAMSQFIKWTKNQGSEVEVW